MLTDVDVPFDGPQTLAYRVPVEPLLSLRDALRAAQERRLVGPLAEQRLRHGQAYREARRAVRWRVPRSTILELTTEVRRACALGAKWIGTDPVVPGAEELEKLLAQCLRLERLVEHTPHLDLTPDRWLSLVLSERLWVRSFLLRPETRYDVFLRGFLHQGTERMERLDLPDEEHDRFWVRKQAILAGQADATAESYEQLEMLVGPYMPSRGPGPFLLPPTCAEPLVDAAEDDLGFWFVHGSTLDDAIAELDGFSEAIEKMRERAKGIPLSWKAWLRVQAERGRCGRAQYEALLKEAGFAEWGSALPPCWKAWHEVQSEWWPRCRERYERLLNDARAGGDAVVFTMSFPDDQGTITAPMSEDLGERVVSPQ